MLGITLAGCSSASKSPTVATVGSQPTTSIAASGGAGASSTSKPTALAEAEAFSECMRSHGVQRFPDPVLTPGGDYGYRTSGIDPNSAGFQNAIQACKDLPSPWNSTRHQLTAAQQQAWLTWAECIRHHGVPDFPDPTFSGDAVQTSPPGGQSPTPQFQRAMGDCRSRMPSTGGLGG